jgi:hypothetical protein
MEAKKLGEFMRQHMNFEKWNHLDVGYIRATYF